MIIKMLLPVMIFFHLVILSKLTFTAWPEMISYPYLFAHGFSLYKDFILPYPPGLLLPLAGIFHLFGFTPDVLKIVTWVVIVLIDLLIYLILRKVLKDQKIIYVFLGLFVILQSFLDGNMLWFDMATIAPLLGAFWFSLKWLQKRSLGTLFFTALFFSLAVLIKQIAIVYLIFFLGFLIIDRKMKEVREICVIGGGILLPVLPLAIYLMLTGAINEFILWTTVYPLTEWSKFPGYVNYLISKREVLISMLLISPLGFFIFNKKSWWTDKTFLLSALLFAAAVIAVYPRFSYFHLQPALAFLVLVLANVYINLNSIKRKLLLMQLSFVILAVVGLVFTKSIGDGVRFYGESERNMAKTVVSLVEPDERVFLLGPSSSIYAFADRLPSKTWTDVFGWYLEIPGIQKLAISGFIKDPPKVVFWTKPLQGQWFDLGVYQPIMIIEYIKENYQPIGMVGSEVEIWVRRD